MSTKMLSETEPTSLSRLRQRRRDGRKKSANEFSQLARRANARAARADFNIFFLRSIVDISVNNLFGRAFFLLKMHAQFFLAYFFILYIPTISS